MSIQSRRERVAEIMYKSQYPESEYIAMPLAALPDEHASKLKAADAVLKYLGAEMFSNESP